MAHVLHQDRLVWDVSQLLIAVQGGVLLSGYALRPHWLSAAILLMGALLTLLLFGLVRKHELDRDVNQRVMDGLAQSLLSERLRRDLRPEDSPDPVVRMSAPASHSHMRGRFILRSVIFLLVAIDVAFALFILFAPEYLPAVRSR